MILALLLNVFLVLSNSEALYTLLLLGQVLFYVSAYLGKVLEAKKVRVKLLFIPYYFCMMNYAVLAGLHRFFFGEQSVMWEKAQRK